jgi:Holliday junction resolvase RusA-like endonuclease
MTNIIEFEVPGKIISYKNPLIGSNKRLYTPKAAKIYKEYIQWAARKYMLINNLEKLQGAISIRIEAYFDIPKSYSKKKIIEIKNNKFIYNSYPDSTDIQKLVEDALKNICFDDDRFVSDIETIKRYTMKKEAYLLIHLSSLKDSYEKICAVRHIRDVLGNVLTRIVR